MSKKPRLTEPEEFIADDTKEGFYNGNILGQPGQRGMGSFEFGKTPAEIQEDERKARLLEIHDKEKSLTKDEETITATRQQLAYLQEFSLLNNKEKKAQFYRMRFGYINYAHRLFWQDFNKNNSVIRMDTPKAMPQAVQQINESTLARQIDCTSFVPATQKATSMWATTFQILEKCATIEKIFEESFTKLFHDGEQHDGAKKCSCFENCSAAQKQSDELLLSNINVAVDPVEKARLTCVASGFFDQFFVPVCFARRNALHQDTCFSDELVKDIDFNRPKEEERPKEEKGKTEEERKKEEEERKDRDDVKTTYFLTTQSLLDVQFLSITDVVNLAMSSLEHPAAMFAFPAQSLTELQTAQDEATEMARLSENERREKRRWQPDNIFYGQQANLDAYNIHPEKVQHRCPNNDAFNTLAREQVQCTTNVREKINAEIRRKLDLSREDFDKEELEEKIARQKSVQTEADLFIQKTENESLQNRVHNTFSEERVEVYKTFVAQKNAKYLYARMRTVQNIAVPKKPSDALNFWIKTEKAKKNAVEFEAFCNLNKAEIEKNGGWIFDELETIRLYAIFQISRDESKSLKDILGERLLNKLIQHTEEDILFQLKTPNFRAWGADVLQKLLAWLDRILVKILQPSQYLGKDSVEFDAYFQDCCNYAPWLFAKRSQSNLPLLSQQKYQMYDDKESATQCKNLLGTQYYNNCKRLWSVSDAVLYFNKFVVNEKPSADNFLSKFEKLFGTCFRAKCSSPSLQKLLIDEHDMDVVKDQSNQCVWTICCEPLMEGTRTFSVYPTIDPLSKYALFGPNQQRDLTRNPYSLFHSYVWRVFRKDWPLEHHKLCPNVAQFCDMVIREYASRKNIEFDEKPDCLYLLSSSAKAFQQKPDSNPIHVAAHEIQSILSDFEFNCKQQRLNFNEENTSVILSYGRAQSIVESYKRIGRVLNYHSKHVHERVVFENKYEYTIPYTCLYALAMLQQQKSQNAKTVVANDKTVASEKTIAIERDKKIKKNVVVIESNENDDAIKEEKFETKDSCIILIPHVVPKQNVDNLTDDENEAMFNYVGHVIKEEKEKGETFTLRELATQTGINKPRISYHFLRNSNPNYAEVLKNNWLGYVSIDLSNEEFDLLYMAVKKIYDRETAVKQEETSDKQDSLSKQFKNITVKRGGLPKRRSPAKTSR